jgi:hypothetical protein
MLCFTHIYEEQLFFTGKAASVVAASPAPFVKTVWRKDIKGVLRVWPQLTDPVAVSGCR